MFKIQVFNPRLFRIWNYYQLDKETFGNISIWNIFANIRYTFEGLKN